VFEEVKKRALKLGINVTGTEIIGLIPEKVLFDAGAYFLSQTNCRSTVSNDFLIETAIEKLGLNDLFLFRPDEKILERKLIF
jgi:glutamate formiminotransferase/formiminotetrahydrofolate cyclodeaminase